MVDPNQTVSREKRSRTYSLEVMFWSWWNPNMDPHPNIAAQKVVEQTAALSRSLMGASGMSTKWVSHVTRNITRDDRVV